MEMADDPIAEGTALNKANLLTDETAALYGLDNEAVPNDVFNVIGDNWTVEKLISITTESSVAQVDLDLTSLDMTKYSKLELIAEIMPQYTGATLATISLAMILNGDSGNNYYSVSSSSSSTTAATYIELSPSLSRRYEASNTCAACDVDILPQHNSVGIYAKYSVTNISTQTSSGGTINGVVGGFRSGLYKGSNFQNITSVSLLFSDSGNFDTGSKITLLGIRK